MRVRDYTQGDREACLAVFDSVGQRFFSLPERTFFAEFLDALPGPYLVVEDQGVVVGCGGYALQKDATTVSLCWGMVRGNLHGKGIGTLLLQVRLERIAREFPAMTVTLSTSQHTRAFYEKFGFVVKRVVADGYAAGLDRVEMYLPTQ